MGDGDCYRCGDCNAPYQVCATCAGKTATEARRCSCHEEFTRADCPTHGFAATQPAADAAEAGDGGRGEPEAVREAREIVKAHDDDALAALLREYDDLRVEHDGQYAYAKAAHAEQDKLRQKLAAAERALAAAEERARIATEYATKTDSFVERLNAEIREHEETQTALARANALLERCAPYVERWGGEYSSSVKIGDLVSALRAHLAASGRKEDGRE